MKLTLIITRAKVLIVLLLLDQMLLTITILRRKKPQELSTRTKHFYLTMEGNILMGLLMSLERFMFLLMENLFQKKLKIVTHEFYKGICILVMLNSLVAHLVIKWSRLPDSHSFKIIKNMVMVLDMVLVISCLFMNSPME